MLREGKKEFTWKCLSSQLYNGCRLNCVTLCPSYCGNPEQYISGVALNRTTVWRASEVQERTLKTISDFRIHIHDFLDKNLPITTFPNKDHSLHSLLQNKDLSTAKP